METGAQQTCKLDASALVQDRVDLVIQVKGKVREPSAFRPMRIQTLEKLALGSEVAQKWLEEQSRAG